LPCDGEVSTHGRERSRDSAEKIVQISLEYRSGLVVSDGAVFDPDTGLLWFSETLTESIVDRLAEEGLPFITASIDQNRVVVEIHRSGIELVGRSPSTVRAHSIELRRQVGRTLHTLGVACLLGFVGVAHTVAHYNRQTVLSLIELGTLAVVFFVMGSLPFRGD
jgi:hypothetical protein